RVGVIYIAHRLEEIFEIGDRVTVLRDGRHIQTCAVSEADKRSLIRAMVGRELEQEFPKVKQVRGEEVFRVKHLSTLSGLHNVSFAVFRGEIFGLAGLVGAGRSQLAHALFGADPVASGKMFLQGKEIRPRSPREAIDLGIGLLTEDRNRYGLIMQMSVRENVSLSNLIEVLRGPFISRRKEDGVASTYVQKLHIKTPTLQQRVEFLSGGNRQKVVLARWLFANCKVLIFDEPTTGIDVGVKYEIYNLINDLAKSGRGMILISSDLPELLGMCDRIGVMCEGRITGVLKRNEATQEKIMTLATGGTIAGRAEAGSSETGQLGEVGGAH
ncbi:MAG: sugar ABC transporter ATP-binding protein, partial [Bacteroidota bacterium]